MHLRTPLAITPRLEVPETITSQKLWTLVRTKLPSEIMHVSVELLLMVVSKIRNVIVIKSDFWE